MTSILPVWFSCADTFLGFLSSLDKPLKSHEFSFLCRQPYTTYRRRPSGARLQRSIFRRGVHA